MLAVPMPAQAPAAAPPLQMSTTTPIPQASVSEVPAAPPQAFYSGYWCYAQQQQEHQSTIPQYPHIPGAPHPDVTPAPNPVQPTVAPAPSAQLPPQPYSGCSPSAPQFPIPPKTPRRGQPPQRGMFEVAKAMAKNLAAQRQSPEGTSSYSEQSPSPPQRRTGYPSPSSFQVLDYNQTTVLAFAYELNPNMDEDVHNCHQLAMHISVHPSVIKVFI